MSENKGGHQPPSQSLYMNMHPRNPQHHPEYQMLPYPLQITLCMEPILLVIWSIYNNPASPTTDQDISDDTLYSPTGSMNRATGECLYRGELGYPVKGTQEN